MRTGVAVGYYYRVYLQLPACLLAAVRATAPFLQDISGRTGETRLSEDAEVAIEIISLVGVVLSLIGLIMTVITLVAFKYVHFKLATYAHTHTRTRFYCISSILP